MSDNSDDALPPEQERQAEEAAEYAEEMSAPQPPQQAYVNVPMPTPPQLDEALVQLQQENLAWQRRQQQYESEPRQRLRVIKDRVSMTRLGGLEVTKPKYISASAVGEMSKWLVGQCIGDGVAQDESGIYIRDLIPYHDLLAGSDGHAITHEDEWITPDPRRFIGGYDDTEMTLYITNRNCYNDRKVILIYGIHNLNDGAPIHLKRLDFQRGTVRRITLTKIDSLHALDGFYFFQTPIIYKKNDNLCIRGTVGGEGIGQTDMIKILGMVGEPLGSNYSG